MKILISISIRQFCKISISIKYRIDSNLAYRTGLFRGPTRQIFPQKFLVKSESTLIFLSKNLSFERKITTNFDSRQKNPFGTNIEFYRKCIYLQLMPIQWHELSRIMVKMWYFVGFQSSKCRNTHIQPRI